MTISRLQQNPYRSRLALLFKFIINFFWSILFRETLIKGAGLNTAVLNPSPCSILFLSRDLPSQVGVSSRQACDHQTKVEKLRNF